jgi:hypothetical protein
MPQATFAACNYGMIRNQRTDRRMSKIASAPSQAKSCKIDKGLAGNLANKVNLNEGIDYPSSDYPSSDLWVA